MTGGKKPYPCWRLISPMHFIKGLPNKAWGKLTPEAHPLAELPTSMSSTASLGSIDLLS